MFIQSIELVDYRNYKKLSVEFDSRTNILYGDNAQGKTNLLESAYLSSCGKSHRTQRDREMIRFGQSEAHVRTWIEKEGVRYRIDIHLRQGKSKGIAINGISIKKASELFGLLNVILFSPEDLNIVKNGPSDRRRFIDMELSQIDRIYMVNLANYKKVLEQRNHLLKEIYHRPDLKETLEVWDQQLIFYGQSLIQERTRFIEELAPVVRRIHEKISGGRERLDIFYEPHCKAKELPQALEGARERDLRSGSSNVGPHRDDLRLMIGDIDVRQFGSQGQQRSCALSLKLAQIDMLEQKTGEKPVLLLDDVLSELDSNRQNFLLDSLSDTQTIITCTGLDEFINHRFDLNCVYHIRDACAVREEVEA